MKPDVNAILKIYLGAGPSGGYQPIGVKERFENAFPHDHAEKLAQISKYLDQDHQPDWSQHTLGEEQIAFAASLARKFPELTRSPRMHWPAAGLMATSERIMTPNHALERSVTASSG